MKDIKIIFLLIKNRLTIVRYLRGLKFEELRAGISQANISTPAPSPEPIRAAQAAARVNGQVKKVRKTNIIPYIKCLSVSIVQCISEQGKKIYYYGYC